MMAVASLILEKKQQTRMRTIAPITTRIMPTASAESVELVVPWT